MKTLFLLVAILFNYCFVSAQSYEVSIQPIAIDNLTGLQSYAVGTHGDEWLLIGGRREGLHTRRPFEAFNVENRNLELIVVNPKTKSVWKASIMSLPKDIKEQFSASNFQFYQNGEYLICVGGYGYSTSEDDHITYPYLTSIDVPKAIDQIKKGVLDSSPFSLVENEIFRVTGGALNMIEDIYFLVGGHKFMGRYNPMGPENGPGFVQEYTNEIRKFKLVHKDTISIEILTPVHDELHLHRRDYNLVPYISDGERALMVYSGVFKNTSDFPWLYPVQITKNKHTPQEEFKQYFNHYHCAYLPIFNQEEQRMHMLFFGGIAQFYMDGNWLVQDNDIPFVNTITAISRDKDGVLLEEILPQEMPGFLGAGSVFIMNDDVSRIDQGIMDGSKIGYEFQAIGHIYGGIRSSKPNVFWINTGQESEASSTIYEVSIRKARDTPLKESVSKKEDLRFYPYPDQKLVRMSITLTQQEDISISISDISGKLIDNRLIPKTETKTGANFIVLDNIEIGYGAYHYTLKIGSKTLKRKVIWTE